jgi:dienelactone hydrolase
MQKHVVVLALLLAAGLCPVAAQAAAGCDIPEITQAMQSDADVAVQQIFIGRWLDYLYVFQPRQTQATTGFIIYPGGGADPRGYAPPAHRLAAQGFLTAIVSMPFDLAVFGSNRALDVIARFREIDTWAIGGHSLGGVMACNYARKFTRTIDAVVMWASYPSETYRIDDKDLKVLSIYGTADQSVTRDEIETSRQHLPENTVWVEIAGATHNQFGYFCDNATQDNATGIISREEQQRRIVEATAGFLGSL